MSKISYCSLEEAWGLNEPPPQDQLKNNKTIDNNKNNIESKYDYLNENSKKERAELIKNMNNVERIPTIKNDSSSEFEKYRFNSSNNVTESDSSKIYTPFNEAIEKKYLLDKLNFLESQFKKYGVMQKSNIQSNTIENFNNNISEENNNENKYSSIDTNTNNNINNQNSKNNNIYSADIIDLIFLIIIGLVIIFIMNSIFMFGKSIGARNVSL